MGGKRYSWDYWLGYRTSSSRALFEESKKRIEIKFLKPSVYYWYADPMIAKIRGEYYVFMEAYHRIKGKGVISVSKLSRGRLSKPKVALEEDFHLSFPNVFEYQGKVYMIPETSNDKSIRIYEMKESPTRWKLVNRMPTAKSYVDIAVDIIENGEIVLFLSEENEQNLLQDKLCIYLFDDFPNGNISKVPIYEGDFAYTNRNAGNIGYYNKKKYRFSQINLTDFYGKKVQINEIDELSKDKYLEHSVGELNSEMFKFPKSLCPEGLHTYNILGGG